MSLELLGYVKEVGASVSAEGYWKWCEDLANPNYVYIQHMVMSYLHSLMMLRAGVHRGSASLVTDAKTKISELFFDGNHPIYQKILYLDMLDDVKMPAEMLNIKKRYVSASRTNTPRKLQGGDAL